jgi:8-oxo-dGTP diphosphatase
MTQAPQFGRPEPGKPSRDRPAAFGLVAREGLIALVRVTYPERPPFVDLPGGAIDPGETEAQALIREFGEETGLKITPGQPFTRADQYFLTKDNEAVNNRAAFFEAEILGEDQSLKIEEDHQLVWLAPHEALRRLRHDAQAWAVAAWLRRRNR